MLKKLKYILASYDDEELEDMELWVDAEQPIEMIITEPNSLTLVSEEGKKTLKIKGKLF